MMIYFLINNNYHHVDLLGHTQSLADRSYSVIEIPHYLDEALIYYGAHATYRFMPPTSGSLLTRLKHTKSLAEDIVAKISPSAGDVLFFYTEYEVLNIHLAEHFRRAGARVYLIEDGGLGTYIPFRHVQSEKLSVKELVKRAMYRYILKLPRLEFVKLNGHVFPRTADETIEAVCLYNPVAIKRKIDVRLIKRAAQPIANLVMGRVVFLNEPIYETFQGERTYLSGLREMLAGLVSAYPDVLFKFHPRETAAWRTRIRDEVLVHFPNVSVIEENAPIELLAETYRPQVLASYFCSALLSLADRGVEPLYLFHLIPELKQQPIFEETGLILKELGYAFIDSYADIGPDYRSGIDAVERGRELASLRDLVASA